MHQTGFLTTKAEPENQYVIFVKKSSLQKPVNLINEDDKKLKKLQNPKRPKQAIPIIR